MVNRIMTATDAEPIIHKWIDEAIEAIKTQTGIVLEHDSVLYELADCEWMYDIVIDEETSNIDMEEAAIQLSYIVERNIENIIAEREEN